MDGCGLLARGMANLLQCGIGIPVLKVPKLLRALMQRAKRQSVTGAENVAHEQLRWRMRETPGGSTDYMGWRAALGPSYGSHSGKGIEFGHCCWAMDRSGGLGAAVRGASA